MGYPGKEGYSSMNEASLLEIVSVFWTKSCVMEFRKGWDGMDRIPWVHMKEWMEVMGRMDGWVDSRRLVRERGF